MKTTNPPTQTPADAPEQVTYDFTPAQAATLAPVLDGIQKSQAFLQFFLNHVVREANLPPVVQGYQLREDGKGLFGTPTK